MAKKQILCYSDTPTAPTGRGIVMKNIADSLGKEFDFTFFGINEFYIDNRSLEYFIIPALPNPHNDPLGRAKFFEYAIRANFDVIFLQIDIFELGFMPQLIRSLHEHLKYPVIITYTAIDAPILRDYADYIRDVDIILVYSEYGFKQILRVAPELKKKMKIIPIGVNPDEYYPIIKDQLTDFKVNVLGVNPDSYIIGNINHHSYRKNFPRTLQFYNLFEKKYERPSVLYLHTRLNADNPMVDRWAMGYNLGQMLNWYVLKHGVIKSPNIEGFNPYLVTTEQMNKIYNCLDLLITTSTAEGFWLPKLYAFATKTPVLMPDHSALSETLEKAGVPIKIQTYHHFPGNDGSARPIVDIDDMVEKAINIADGKLNPRVEEGFKLILTDFHIINVMKGFREVFNIEKIKPIFVVPKITNENDILYALDETAGDVLLGTSAIPGVKAKFPESKLVYMTKSIYKDILEGNPDIDEVVDWNVNLLNKYKKMYMIHEPVLRGNWGTADVPLYRIYADMLNVSWTEPKIYPKIVNDFKYGNKEFFAIHTSGGHPFRVYSRFAEVITHFKNIPFVQVGGNGDIYAEGVSLDLRGKLSFRETAFILAQAKLVICIDSFISHCAASVGTQSVVLYGTGAARVTQPYRMTIGVEPDYVRVCPILGPCFGNRMDCRPPYCINTIPPADVIKAINYALEKGGN